MAGNSWASVLGLDLWDWSVVHENHGPMLFSKSCRLGSGRSGTARGHHWSRPTCAPASWAPSRGHRCTAAASAPALPSQLPLPAAVHLLKFCLPIICCCLSSISLCSRRQQDEHTFHLPSAGRPPAWVFTLFKLPSQLCWWVWFRVVEKWQLQFLCLVVDMHWRHDVTEALSSPPLSVRSCEGSKH